MLAFAYHSGLAAGFNSVRESLTVTPDRVRDIQERIHNPSVGVGGLKLNSN
jgi:hypothetical protein